MTTVLHTTSYHLYTYWDWFRLSRQSYWYTNSPVSKLAEHYLKYKSWRLQYSVWGLNDRSVTPVDGFRLALETHKHAHSHRCSHAQESAEILGCGSLEILFWGQRDVSSKFSPVAFLINQKANVACKKVYFVRSKQAKPRPSTQHLTPCSV